MLEIKRNKQIKVETFQKLLTTLYKSIIFCILEL